MDIRPYISMITLNVNGLNAPTKRHRLDEWIQNKTRLIYMLSTKDHLRPREILRLKVQNSLMDSVREGEGGKIWENGIETCIISCMKRVTSPGSMHDTGCLGLVHWDDPEG